MALKLGIDVGSTTVKLAVLDAENNLLFHSYQRHFSNPRQCTLDTLYTLNTLLDGQTIHMAITGSAGLGIAKAANLPFAQEVYATAKAVYTFIPDTDAVVELGGEDAKIIFFGNSLEERMNGSCAGGTGAFIDQMATLLNLTPQELDTLYFKHEKIYPIASRCGVFAKSDIQPILNQGGRKEDLAASIYQAVVDQTVAGLTQGRELSGKIVFLGGPLHFLMGLRDRFAKTLQLDENHAIFPENGACYAAIGAALCGDEGIDCQYDSILSALEKSAGGDVVSNTLSPLFTSEKEYEEFSARHNSNAPPAADIKTYQGKAYLGIDAGSTTTKLVLIDDQGGILYSYYHSNEGSPVAVVQSQLAEIYALCENRIQIYGAAVTGYGEELIQNAFSCDMGLVETMAHYGAAAYFNPQVDFIIDIGGQDMKCFKVRAGTIDGILLNEACSSGCGSFIETFSRALGQEISEFSKLGLLSKQPADLGSRCTVFMNSSVKQAQKDGAGVDDISAGLSISVVKNAIYKVIRAANADQLGKNIVVQGGTFLNDAVLRAFELELGRNVVRPTIAGLMGAFGAALAVKEKNLSKSSLISPEKLSNFSHTAKPATCGLCTNHCAMTINTFDSGRRFVSGNRCTRPLGEVPTTLPDMMKYKYEKMRTLHGRGTGTGTRGKIGIALGLNMYENLPFWFEFFTSLDFEVVLSNEFSRAMYQKGQRTIPSDTVCYPAKLMHGQMEDLNSQGVCDIFHPCLPYNFDEGKGDNHYNCPVVAYYPELLGANMTNLQSVRYHTPYFGLHRPRDFEDRAAKWCFETFQIEEKKTRLAAKHAYRAYETHLADIRKTGEDYIAYAREHNLPIMVVAGRPYHVDSEINHGINGLITGLGFVLITEDAIAHKVEKAPRKVLDQWTYHTRMYNAARYVCTQKDMQMIQLVSFGCGIDAITGDELREILEDGGKFYTQLKIDDINNLGAVKIRIRSLVAAMHAQQKGARA